MGRETKRLTVLKIRSIKKPGLHADGDGLYLNTTGSGRRWVFIYRWAGKRCEMGLGSESDVSLVQARELAAQARALVLQGMNPIECRKGAATVEIEVDPQPETESAPLFGAFAESYVGSIEHGFRNAKHRQQWRNSIKQHASTLADKPVDAITTDDVLAVLQPIWREIPETASRVRGRIEKVLAAAAARGLRPRDAINPAQWRGHLEVLLPKRQRLTRGHHAAMPYEQLPNFMQHLAMRSAMAARTLEFLILTAARSGEVLGATWQEVDLGAATWTVPAHRMKAGIAHTVTLSPAAVQLLKRLKPGKPLERIFPGRGGGQQSVMALTMLLRRMDRDDVTPHGFRSSFKDWAANETEFADEISEEALAHVIGSKVRRAYRRGEALERRRKLMVAWADFAMSGKPALEWAA